MTRDRTRPPSPVIDPRLEARRVEVARDNGRRRLRKVLIALTVLLVLLGLGALTRSPLLDVDEVVVRGADQVPAATVRTAAGVPLGKAMVSVDPARVTSRLEALPWVEDATVTRSWPGTITISVRERTPVAVIGSGPDAVLVDHTGRVLGAVGERGAALPSIGDDVPAGAQVPAYRQLLAATLAGLPADLRGEVARAFPGPQGVTLVLRDDIRVLLGDPGRLTAKADSLAILLDQADRATIERIDLTVPSAPALTRRQQGGA